MKRNVLSLVCVLALAAGSFTQAYGAKVKGNGTIVTREVTVGDYAVIKLGPGVECNSRLFSKSSYENPVFYYKQWRGGATLQVTIDENLFPLLEITTLDNELMIGVEKGTTINPSKMILKGSSKDLQGVTVSGCVDFITEDDLASEQLAITISGASDVIMKGKAAVTQFKVHISGAGDFTTENLACGSIESSVSGAGDINLTGKAATGKFTVTGAGDIRAYDFEVKNLECRVSGAGDIKATATETLNASVFGAGDIRYKGNPKANTRVSGAGDIKRIEN